MTVAPERKEQTRLRILEAASRLYRRYGYHETSVRDVMAEAGLTVGGFYAHFQSKEHLFAEALRHASQHVYDDMPELAGKRGLEWARMVMDDYLSVEHLNNPETGCPMPSVLSELLRTDQGREAFEEMASERILPMAGHLAEAGFEPEDALDRAVGLMSLALGGFTAARLLREPSKQAEALARCRRCAHVLLDVEDLPEPSSTNT